MNNTTRTEEPSFYAIIPANVRYCKTITPNAKLLFGELSALTSSKGFCYATNSYLCELYDVDKVTISRWISSLQEHGFINVSEFKQENGTIQRRIFMNTIVDKNDGRGVDEIVKGGLTKRSRGGIQKDQGGVDNFVNHINTVINTENIKKNPQSDKSPVPLKFSENISSLTNDEPLLEADARIKPPRPAPPKPKQTDPLHKPFMEVYCEWYKGVVGSKPSIDVADAAAMKALIKKVKTKVGIKTPDAMMPKRFKDFLETHKKWAAYNQKNIRVRDINSQFDNICASLALANKSEAAKKTINYDPMEQYIDHEGEAKRYAEVGRFPI